MRTRSWALLALVVTASCCALIFAGCGGSTSSSSSDVGTQGRSVPAAVATPTATPAPSTASGIVVPPPGSTIQVTDLTVQTASGTSAVNADGSFNVPAQAFPTIAYLVNKEGKLVMMAFVSADATTVSFLGKVVTNIVNASIGNPPERRPPGNNIGPQATATVLMYFALGAWSLPDTHFQPAITLIHDDPVTVQFTQVVAAAIAANPTALTDGDASVVDAMLAAKRSLLAPALASAGRSRIASDANLVLHDTNELSGVQLQDSRTQNGAIFTSNRLRRRCALFLYKTAQKATDANDPVFFAQAQQQGDATELKPISGATGVLSTIFDAVSGKLNTFESDSDNFVLPVDAGFGQTLYTFVVVGPSTGSGASPVESDPHFTGFKPIWDSEVELLNLETYTFDVVLPILSKVISVAPDAGKLAGLKLDQFKQYLDLVKDMIFIIDQQQKGNLQKAIDKSDFPTAVRLFFDALKDVPPLKDRVKAFLQNLAGDGLLILPQLGQAQSISSLISRADVFVKAIDLGLVVTDAGRIGLDLGKASRVISLDAKAVQFPISLDPAQAQVFPGGGSRTTLRASVRGTQNLNVPGTFFTYRFTTPGLQGQLDDGNGHIGSDIKIVSGKPSIGVAYVANPTAQQGEKEVVQVDIAVTGPPTVALGTKQSTMTIQPPVTLAPPRATLSAGGSQVLTATAAQGVPSRFQWKLTTLVQAPAGLLKDPVSGASGLSLETTTPNIQYVAATKGPNVDQIDTVSVSVLDSQSFLGSAESNVTVNQSPCQGSLFTSDGTGCMVGLPTGGLDAKQGATFTITFTSQGARGDCFPQGVCGNGSAAVGWAGLRYGPILSADGVIQPPNTFSVNLSGLDSPPCFPAVQVPHTVTFQIFGDALTFVGTGCPTSHNNIFAADGVGIDGGPWLVISNAGVSHVPVSIAP